MEIGIAMIFCLALIVGAVAIYFLGTAGSAAASGQNTQDGTSSRRGRRRPTHTAVEDDGERAGRPEA
jgi:hypothetical protein